MGKVIAMQPHLTGTPSCRRWSPGVGLEEGRGLYGGDTESDW